MSNIVCVIEFLPEDFGGQSLCNSKNRRFHSPENRWYHPSLHSHPKYSGADCVKSSFWNLAYPQASRSQVCPSPLPVNAWLHKSFFFLDVWKTLNSLFRNVYKVLMTWSFLSFPFLRDYVYFMWVNVQPSCTVFPTSRPEVARETALPLQLAAIHSGPIDAVDRRKRANRENCPKHGIGLRHPRVLIWVSSLFAPASP